MSKCQYFAPNGEPSIMFNSLFEHYKGQYDGDVVEAEKAAVKAWIRTQTEAFKTWFGDSKVVDANGEPLVVYHGTLSKFDAFHPNSHFSPNIQQSQMAVLRKKDEEDRYDEQDSYLGLFLNIKNPKRIDDIKANKDWLPAIEQAKKEGYDGLVYLNQGENFVYRDGDKKGESLYKDDSYVNFDANQIKSVDNIGYFDNAKDDIMAMVDRKASRGNSGNTATTEGEDFYMFASNIEALESGKKTVSIRPQEYRTGVYRFGENYYRVSTRGFKSLSELRETPAQLQNKFIGDDDIKYSHIVKFFTDDAPMHVYDIKKIDIKDDPSAMADVVGTMKMKMGDVSTFLTQKNDLFKNYITALNDNIERLKSERRIAKGNKFQVEKFTARIEKQEKVLKRLQGNKTVKAIIEIGIDQLADIKKYALKPNASLIELTEGLRITKAWKDLNVLIDFDIEGKTPVQIDVIKVAKDLQADAANMYSSVWNKIISHIKELGIQYNVDISKIIVNDEFVFKDINWSGSMTLSTGTSSNALEQLVTQIKNSTLAKNNQANYAFLTERDRMKRELLGSKDANDQVIMEKYTVDGVNEETGDLIKIEREGIIAKYDRAFTAERAKLKHKAETRKIPWKEYYAFERKHYNYHPLSDKAKEAWEAYKKQVREDPEYILAFDSNNEPVFNEEAIQKKLDHADPYIFQQHLDDASKTANSGGSWFDITPKANVPLNPAYTKLSEKEKEYHAWFTNTFAKHHANLIIDKLNDIDIDELLGKFAKDVDTASKAKYLVVGDFMKDMVMITVGTTKGQVVTRPLTDDEHLKVPFKNIIEFIPENNKRMHPSDILTNFVSASISSKNKREVEEVMNTMANIAKVAKKQQVNSANTSKKNRSGGNLITQDDTNISKRVSYTTEEFLTGNAKEEHTTSEGTSPGERGLSWGRTFDTLNKVTRLRYMAFSPLSALGNFAMGAMNNTIYASGGRYFSDKELVKASWMVKGSIGKFYSESLTGNKISAASDQTKLIAEIMYSNNMIGDVTEQLTHGESALNKLFALQKGGEFLVQGASALAQMFHTPVTFKDGSKDKNLFDIYTLNQDGRAVINKELLADDSPFQSDAAIAAFFDRAKAVNEKIHGDYNNPLLGKKTVVGRSLFMFRTWLPMAVKERFGTEYEHQLLGTQKGRWISAAQLIASPFYQKGTKDQKGHFRFSKEEGKDFMKAFFKFILPGLGHKINLSDRISEIDRENINMAIREFQILLLVTGAMALAKINVTDDDDDERKGFWTFVYNQTDRMQSELSFYFAPSSYNQLFKSIIPLTSTLTDGWTLINTSWGWVTDHENDEYKAGVREEQSKAGTAITKFIPLTHSAETVWSAFQGMHNKNYGR